MAGVYKGNTTGIEAQIKAKRRKKLRQESRQVRGGRNRGMSPFVAASHTGLLWSGTNKNQDISTGPFARPFARSLAPLTHSLAPDCSLCSCPPLRSLLRSLAHSAHSLARGKLNYWCLKMTWLCPIVRPSHYGSEQPNDGTSNHPQSHQLWNEWANEWASERTKGGGGLYK